MIIHAIAVAFAVAAAQAPGPEAEVRAILDDWLAAQNQGDFASYDKLYAKRFAGVRRSGPRTRRFDRRHWMVDRGKMFKKPMTVSLSDVRVRTIGAAVTAEARQSFASGNFADAGDKRFIFVREDGQWRISVEEMLRSTIASRLDPKAYLPFAMSGALLISREPPESFAHGAPRLSSLNMPVVVERAASHEALPPELAALVGTRVTTYDLAGKACPSHIRELRLVAAWVPHFSTEQEWREQGEAKHAQQAWNSSESSTHFLVGILDKSEPCLDARWWHPGGVARKTVTPVAADDSLVIQARRNFRKLEAHRALQASFKETTGSSRPWDDASLTVERYAFEERGRSVELVSAYATVWEGCATFSGSLLALWEVSRDAGGKSVWTLRNDPSDVSGTPGALADIDGDGLFDLMIDAPNGGFGDVAAILSQKNGMFRELNLLSLLYFDCPC